MKKADGFTLIEMMLAMAFVAFLMITIALTTIHIGNTYSKGLTLSQVNEAGRTISADMQRTITQAPVKDTIQTGQAGLKAVCFGNYSYIWNEGEAIATTPQPTNLVLYNMPGSPLHNQPVRLAKVPDPTASYCASGASRRVSNPSAVELLPAGDRNLAIHSLDVEQLTTAATQTLYEVAFVLGTNTQAALTTNNLSCKPPSDMQSDINYCSVNRFDFLVRAGGGR